jgi:hypothetical protein
MRADLDTLLPEAGSEPTAPLDPDVLWARGRRRRTVRRLTTAGGSLAGVAALALVASGIIGGVGPAVPEITPMSPPATVDTDPDPDAVPAAPEAPGGTEAAEETTSPFEFGDGRTAAEERRLASASEQQAVAGESSDTADAPGSEAPDATATTPPSDDTVATDTATDTATASGPTPDWARADDPCAVHDDGEMRAFIDVVSPVQGQQVGDGVALVGCSSVYEGTIRYRLSLAGTVVVEGFTTATAGGPELGEFREWIPLSTAGRHTLEVFWDSPADGEGERDVRTLNFDAG